MILNIITTLIALFLYNLIDRLYKTFIIKRNKEKLHAIIGDLVYSSKMDKEDSISKDFWGE